MENTWLFVFFRLELIICYYLVNKTHRPKLLSFLSFERDQRAWNSQPTSSQKAVSWLVEEEFRTDLLLGDPTH